MRIRTIKPGFFRNEELAELPALTRILFIGLWSLADRDGRLEDRPKRIKADVLPYDEWDVDRALQALHDGGFIIRYKVAGSALIQIPRFSEHQRITGKEADTPSQYPAPTREDDRGDLSKLSGEPALVQDESGEATGKQSGNNGETVEMTGREGKGRDRNRKGRESIPPPMRERGSENGDGDDMLLAASKVSVPEESGQTQEPVIPTVEEVIAFGATFGAPEEFCRNYHAKTTETHHWLTATGKLILWRKQLPRWWADDRPAWEAKQQRQQQTNLRFSNDTKTNSHVGRPSSANANNANATAASEY